MDNKTPEEELVGFLDWLARGQWVDDIDERTSAAEDYVEFAQLPVAAVERVVKFFEWMDEGDLIYRTDDHDDEVKLLYTDTHDFAVELVGDYLKVQS